MMARNPIGELPTGLPGDLAGRLQRLADDQTAGSQPWPGVGDAVRRSHRRRMASVATVSAATVLVAGAAFGGLIHTPQDTRPTIPAVHRTAPPVNDSTPVTLASAGYTGAIGGSLGTDTGWLTALRSRVVTLTSDNRTSASDAADVHVLWTGDLGGGRFAVVLYRQSNGSWSRGSLEGPQGATIGRMGLLVSSGGDTQLPTGSEGTFIRVSARKDTAVAFVTAPKATGVQIAATRTFSPVGVPATTWRPLQKQGGMVWAGQITAAQAYLLSYRVSGMPSETGEMGANGVNDPGPEDQAARIASPGTDRGALDCASSQARFGGASILEQPVIATTRALSSRHFLAATVLRSPGGGYLYGICDWTKGGAKDDWTSQGASTNAVSPVAFTDPGRFMAATELSPDNERRYIVIAPQGAVSVRIDSVTAPVTSRLAVLTLPDDPSKGLRAEALAEDGSVIGSVPLAHNEVAGFSY